MIYLISALNWLKSNWKLVLIVSMAIALFWFYRSNKALKKDNTRVRQNFEQVTRDNVVLNVTYEEFKQLDTKYKKKLDSLMESAKIKPKSVKSATIINTVYKDTGSTKIVYKEPKQRPDKSYLIQVSVNGDCWGLNGQILSKDSSSKLEITERFANNSTQLVVQRRKKFLFWTVRKESFKAYRDCGEMTVTQINFIK